MWMPSVWANIGVYKHACQVKHVRAKIQSYVAYWLYNNIQICTYFGMRFFIFIDHMPTISGVGESQANKFVLRAK